MKISPVSYNIYFKNSNLKKQTKPELHNYDNIAISNNTYIAPYVNFKGLMETTSKKSELLNKGYEIARIENNQIVNSQNKILIESAQDIIALSNTPKLWEDGNFVLTNDIDMSDDIKFKPIGNAEKSFSGCFDGDGFVIKNLKLNSPNTDNIGLLGRCDFAKLININLADVNLSGRENVGALTGFAKNCEIENCKSSGNISAVSKAGGLIGSGINNNVIKNISSTAAIKGIDDLGGLVGADKNSKISTSFFQGVIKGQENIGGFIGYSTNTALSDVYCKAEINGDKNVGIFIGMGNISNIENAYSKSGELQEVGFSINSNTLNCYKNDDIFDFSNFEKFKNENWTLLEGQMPRLRLQFKEQNPAEVFLEDINYDIKFYNKGWKLSNDDFEIKTLLPPKHYQENENKLKEIKSSINEDFLKSEFEKISYETKGTDNDRYDELLLELVKNPAFPINYRSEGNTVFYSINCTPLFILTTINRPYILQEALKRNNLDIEKTSGSSGTMTITKRAIENNLLDCLVVILKANNHKIPTEKYKRTNNSEFVQGLLKSYPNVDEYLNPNICSSDLEKLSSKIYTLKDVLTSLEVDKNFVDSNGNNIAHIAVGQDDGLSSVDLLMNASVLGVDLEQKNNDGKKPFDIAFENENYVAMAYLLTKNIGLNKRDEFGNNSLGIFSKIKEKGLAINLMKIALDAGISINCTNDSGTTALNETVRLKHYDKMKFLLSNGASPDIPDKKGNTPLHYACHLNDETAIKILLDNFAKIDVPNNTSKYPKSYLKEENLIKTFEMYEKLYKENSLM